MVGAGSPSRLGIAHNNSHILNDQCGGFINSGSFGSLTSGFNANRVLTPATVWGLLPCEDDAVRDPMRK
jgi:hypothetical protein